MHCFVRFPAVLLLGFSFLITACNRPQDRIVGKWKVQSDTSGIVWEFSPNGTVKVGNTNGRFTFGDQKRIKIQTPSATFVYQIELRDDTMMWTKPDGSRTELKRLP